MGACGAITLVAEVPVGSGRRVSDFNTCGCQTFPDRVGLVEALVVASPVAGVEEGVDVGGDCLPGIAKAAVGGLAEPGHHRAQRRPCLSLLVGRERLIG